MLHNKKKKNTKISREEGDLQEDTGPEQMSGKRKLKRKPITKPRELVTIVKRPPEDQNVAKP